MRYLFLSFLMISATIVIFASCNKDKTLADCNKPECTPGSVSYENDIVPLIQGSCSTGLGPLTGCHDAWIFEYNNVKTSVDNGVFLSVILDKSMPKTPNSFGIDTLTQEQIQLFECWICDGALEN
ncbi:MAG: hypothetical protein MK066_09335 [Crocinitomicaceae bacterium]|nr:hypothetical protein [Crocinitomicaceae bacterium]